MPTQIYRDMFPMESVAVPTQLTLDKSIDPIAYSVFGMSTPSLNDTNHSDFVTSPYVHGTDEQLRVLRQHYYAAVAWADHAAGQVLQELDRLGLTDDTMVVLHSDHGWHLGTALRVYCFFIVMRTDIPVQLCWSR